VPAATRSFESFSGPQLYQLLGVSIITGLLWLNRARSNNVSAIEVRRCYLQTPLLEAVMCATLLLLRH